MLVFKILMQPGTDVFSLLPHTFTFLLNWPKLHYLSGVYCFAGGLLFTPSGYNIQLTDSHYAHVDSALFRYRIPFSPNMLQHKLGFLPCF